MKRLAKDRLVVARVETSAVLCVLITYAATVVVASLAIVFLCRAWGG